MEDTVIPLFNAQRQAGKFKIQVDSEGMKLFLPNRGRDYIFNVTRDSAIQLHRITTSIFEPKASNVPCQLRYEASTLNIKMELDSESHFVSVEINGGCLDEQIVFPAIAFRINEVFKLQRVLEQYWKIFAVPALGDVLGNAIDDGWPDVILWDFPPSAVNEFTTDCLSSPDNWSWVEDVALVVATDGRSTWFAIQMRNGKFVWLTKTF